MVEKIRTTLEFAWDENFVFNGESHEMWEIVFVEEGGVVVTEEERVYTLSKNNMVIHAPYEFHRIRSDGKSRPKVKVLSFYAKGELPEELKEGVFMLSAEEREEYLYTFKRARTVRIGEAVGEFDEREAVCRIFAFLIRLSKRATQSPEQLGSSAKTYNSIARFMLENVEENLGVDEICEKNYVSHSYIKALFEKYAGVSPKSYYTHLMIKRINTLLLEGLSMSEISRRMNFSSQNYLSSFYKKHMGVSPSEYQRKNGRVSRI